ncbi:MAG TPA: hypothetical protein VLS47_00750 [Gallionella sp.]|nr:hypothetical protein [Gallionella sp.]
MKRLLVTTLLVLSVFPVSAAAEGGMFGKGSTQFSLTIGNGYAFDNSYFVIGGSVSHYVLDGLGVGLSLENWSGGGPGITKYAPFAQYVFNMSSPMQPYVGGFYRHTAISGLPGIDSVGERAGIYIASAPNVYISFGFVHEAYLDCRQTIYRTCSETYPDISFTFGF